MGRHIRLRIACNDIDAERNHDHVKEKAIIA